MAFSEPRITELKPSAIDRPAASSEARLILKPLYNFSNDLFNELVVILKLRCALTEPELEVIYSVILSVSLL
jgi:hypothetical protein